MFSNEWKYESNKKDFICLEPWMKFSIELAKYVKSTSLPIKVYISVPSNLLFSYFFVLGAIDYDFKNPSKKTLLDQYLSLQKGQRILYKTGKEWVAHSIIEVGKIPNSETRAIVAKAQLNSTIYIPEKRWFDYVRIHDDEITKVRNTRRVSNVKDLTENAKLKNLYPEDNLSLLMMQNTPKTYLYANKKEWKDNTSLIELEMGAKPIQLDELLFDGTEDTFKNLSFIEQNHASTLPNGSTIIFVGSGRVLRKMDQFKEQKCVFIVDQHDSNEKSEELQSKIEQEFLMEQVQSFNREILEYMDSNQVQIPKGVEIFAWLSKS